MQLQCCCHSCWQKPGKRYILAKQIQFYVHTRTVRFTDNLSKQLTDLFCQNRSISRSLHIQTKAVIFCYTCQMNLLPTYCSFVCMGCPTVAFLEMHPLWQTVQRMSFAEQLAKAWKKISLDKTDPFFVHTGIVRLTDNLSKELTDLFCQNRSFFRSFHIQTTTVKFSYTCQSRKWMNLFQIYGYFVCMGWATFI